MTYQRISDDERVQSHYERLMRKYRGNHARAKREADLVNWDMLCGIQTDSTFLAQKGTLLKQCEGVDSEAERIASHARAHGYNPSPNDFYVPTLADYCGDPKAFISHAGGGRSQVKRLCQERMVSCSGAVNYTAPERPPMGKKDTSKQRAREQAKYKRFLEKRTANRG